MIAEDQKLYIFELLPKDNEFFETQGVRAGKNGKSHFVAPVPVSRYLLPGEKDDYTVPSPSPATYFALSDTNLWSVAEVAYNNVQEDYRRRTGICNDIRLFKNLPWTVQQVWIHGMRKVAEFWNKEGEKHNDSSTKY